MKAAFIIKNKNLSNAVCMFAEKLGLSVDSDNFERKSGEAISIGTSKKYVVAGNSKPSFYEDKYDLNVEELTTDNVLDCIEAIITHYNSSADENLDTTFDGVSDEIDDSGYNHEIINLLVAKVKKQKKSIKNYWVVANDFNDYSLTTNADADGVVGNLFHIFNEINAD